MADKDGKKLPVVGRGALLLQALQQKARQPHQVLPPLQSPQQPVVPPAVDVSIQHVGIRIHSFLEIFICNTHSVILTAAVLTPTMAAKTCCTVDLSIKRPHCNRQRPECLV